MNHIPFMNGKRMKTSVANVVKRYMSKLTYNYPIAAILRDISLRIIKAKADICRRIVSQKLAIFATVSYKL